MAEPIKSVTWTRVPECFSLEGYPDGRNDEALYKLECKSYIFDAKTGRSICKGLRPCAGTPIEQDDLRLGVWVEFGNTVAGFQWRHWRCVTTKQIENMRTVYDYLFEIEGFHDLDSEDRHMVERALENFKIDLDDAGTIEPGGDPTPQEVPQTPPPSDSALSKTTLILRRQRAKTSSIRDTQVEANRTEVKPTQSVESGLPPETPSSPVKSKTKLKAKAGTKIKAPPVEDRIDFAQTMLFANAAKGDDDEMVEVRSEA
ncbi:BQ5605_C002g01603 [Microbotryum silenes-dioicae]|uniref:BQ5605_C002g01603 protein n=1 Tax=Microbotryum silenes-dioicae TaxID=796604 RepID=A0A2X0LZ89_9BASI|nr:BQ5605_C002g01603 [Microbotryum silenes-dioicae]